MKTISIESYNEMSRLLMISEKCLKKTRDENRKLKEQIEVLKKFSIIGEFYEKEFIRNLR